MKSIPLIFTALFLASCTSSFQGISVIEPESPFPQDIRTAHVSGVELPAFLGPIVVSNLSVAVAELGVLPIEQGADALVTVRFNSVPTNGDAADPEYDVVDAIGHSSQTRFIAQLVVEVRRADEQEIYWSGTIQRLHTVGPGDYMHTGPASPAILEAFRALLGQVNELAAEQKN